MLVNQTILIFGSDGFIGKELVRKLLCGKAVLLLATRKNDHPDEVQSGKYIKTDMLFSKTSEAFEILKKIDVVINCAGEVANESKMYETNVTLVEKLLDMIEFGGINRFIHLGSAGIYKKKGTVSVSSEILPENYYEKTKWEADQLILAHTGHIQAQIIRPTSVIGKNMKNQSFIQLLRLYKKIGFITIANPSKTYFHYVSTETVVEAIEMCIQAILKASVYLVCTDITQKEFCICLPTKVKRIYIPYILFTPLALLNFPGVSKARIRHLRDKSVFVSNIDKFNEVSYKTEVLKRVIKSFDVF